MRTSRRVQFVAIALFLTQLYLGQRVQAQSPSNQPGPVVSDQTGFLYQPSRGSFWDPSVIYANGQYYMFSMYHEGARSAAGGGSVWLATSQDGVHWKDYGVVLQEDGFKNNTVWKQYVAKVGDRYILNHGAFTDQGTNNNLIRFYESLDLIHWKYLYEVPIDSKFYLANGRWDHMWMMPTNAGKSSDGCLGYNVADPIDHGGFGMMESPDCVHYHPIKAPAILADFKVPTMEVGGIEKFGSKYYLIAGNQNHHGFYGYGVYTFVADSPMGPFRPDLPAYRLTGTSGIDGNYYIHVLDAFVKDSPDTLVSEPFTFRATTGTGGQGVWFLPMRRAIVDGEGHLRLAYWTQNDLAKGDEIRVDAGQNTVVFPPGQTDRNAIIRVATASNSITVHTDKSWRPFPWLDSRKTRKGVLVLNQQFDLNKGLIVEGTVQARSLTSRGYAGPGAVNPWQDAKKTYAGFYIEGINNGLGTAILLEAGEPQWRESLIGTLRLDTDFHFEPLDATGPHSATVTGLDNARSHTFRLWIRGGQMELYVDDLLMQSFFFHSSSGRIGFISQESEAQFSNLKVYEMNLSNWDSTGKK